MRYFGSTIAGIAGARGSLQRACAAVMLLGFAACVPVEEAEPFPEDVTKAITPGTSTRKDVLAAFGKPHSTNHDQRLFAYSEQQVQALLFLPGGYLGVLVEEIGPHFTYLVSFAPNGKVQSARVVKDIGDYCRSDGSCLMDMNILDTWVAKPDEQAAAKKKQPVPGKCAIYLFRTGGMGGTGDHLASDEIEEIMLDGSTVVRFEDLSGHGLFYHYFVVQPGTHRLEYIGETDPFYQPRPFTFDCKAGEVVYIDRTKETLESEPGFLFRSPTKVAISFMIQKYPAVDMQLAWGRMLAK